MTRPPDQREVDAVNTDDLDLFLKSCGGPLELLVTSPGEPAVRQHAPALPFAVLGRAPQCDVCLQNENVSRRHLYLQRIDGRVFFADLASRSGVRFRDEPRPFGWLGPDDELAVEGFTIRPAPGTAPHPPTEDVNPLEPYGDELGPEPGAVLEFANGRTRQPRWRLNRTLTLAGRFPTCKLRLDSGLVSRYHCSLLHTPQGVWALDLHSREGTRVNGQPIAWARLADGDRLEIGPFLIRLWYEAPSARARVTRLFQPRPTRLTVAEASPVVLNQSATEAHANTLPVPRSETEQALLLPVINQFNLMQQQMFDQFHQTMVMMVQMFGSLHREQMELIRDELDHLHQVTRELQELRTELVKQPAPAAPLRPAAAPRPAVETRRAPQPASGPARSAQPAPAAPLPGEKSSPHPDGADIHAWLNRRIASLEEERQGRWQKILGYVLGK